MKNNILIKIVSIILLFGSVAFAVQIECVEGCNSCLNPFTCQSCQPGKQCCYQTCSQCVNQVTCLNCTSPYVLNPSTGICVLSVCPVACAECNNTVCSSCDAGSMLVSLTNECLPCPTFCEQCESSTQCTTCLDRYYLTTNLTCSPCLSNCFYCKSATTCSACIQGYYLEKGVCSPCTANCQYCNSTTTCSQCSAGFYLNQNYQCIPCQSSCLQCVDSYNCTSCASGYGLLKGVCVLCSNQFSNCTSCEQDQNKLVCTQCQIGFYVYHQKTCLPCINNCISCSTGTCQQCQATYYYNSFLNSCENCTQDNCQKCDGGSVCTQCADGTFLATSTVNGTCQSCPTGCSICTGIAYCLSCSQGYYRQANTCYPCLSQCTDCSYSPSQCTGCITGFYLDIYTLRCLPCPDFCPECADPTNCTKCSPSFYLSKSQCIQCSTENCLSCQNNKCTLCTFGYYLNGNSCNSCPQNCDICENNTCSSCSQGYFLSNGVCSACLKNCQFCSNQSSCSHCATGFFLAKNNTSCQPCNPTCVECMNNNTCTSCTNNRYLVYSFGISTGQCDSCISPCVTCVDTATTCLSCTTGYFLLQSGVCNACQQGCYDCNNAVGCLVCLSGYLKINLANATSLIQQRYKCYKCPPNCISCQLENESKNIVCSNCQPGYSQSSTGSCYQCGVEQTIGCQVCHDEIVVDANNHSSIVYTCPQCLPGFMINDTTQLCVPDQGGSSSGVFFIICIVALSVGCAIVLGMVIYNCFCGNKDESSMYSQIE